MVAEAGFINPTITNHLDSQIPGWPLYLLDNNLDGSPYKPDSLYLEANKP